MGFAHCKRVYHLVSSGWIAGQEGIHTHDIPNKDIMCQVSPGPQALIATGSSRQNYVAKQLGLGVQEKAATGQ